MRVAPLRQLEIKRDALKRQLQLVDEMIEREQTAEERRPESVAEAAERLRRSPEYSI